MKIVFVNRFFFPDTSATSQIATDLASHLARRGYEVHAVTSSTGEEKDEALPGVTIHRVSRAPKGPHNLIARAFAYARFYVAARRAISRIAGPGDVVIAKTDPPLLAAAIGPVAKRRGARVVVWLQDVFPEIAREYGIPAMRGPLGHIAAAIRDRSLRSADRVVAIGERMARRVASASALDRVEVIHNWADEAIRPMDPASSGLRRDWGLGDAFVVAYSGNLGRVHEFDTILGAAKRLAADPGIRFLVVGSGPRLDEVRAAAQRERLDNVVFQPHQPRALLSQGLAAADVHLCVLRPEFEGLVHPSKLYGIMAAGGPTWGGGAAESESGAILAAADAGIAIRSGDAQALAEAIVQLRADASLRARLGRNARRAFEERYALPLAAARWERLLEDLK